MYKSLRLKNKSKNKGFKGWGLRFYISPASQHQTPGSNHPLPFKSGGIIVFLFSTIE
jgi:hypothetical protein